MAGCTCGLYVTAIVLLAALRGIHVATSGCRRLRGLEHKILEPAGLDAGAARP